MDDLDRKTGEWGTGIRRLKKKASERMTTISKPDNLMAGSRMREKNLV